MWRVCSFTCFGLTCATWTQQWSLNNRWPRAGSSVESSTGILQVFLAFSVEWEENFSVTLSTVKAAAFRLVLLGTGTGFVVILLRISKARGSQSEAYD